MGREEELHETVRLDTGPEEHGTKEDIPASVLPEKHLSKLLSLQPIGPKPDRFVGAAHDKWVLPRTFGGLTVAQALIAACRTVKPNQRIHSLHSYFLRGGDAAMPVIYQVSRTRDGHSFSSRRVEALQQDNVILEMLVSFKTESESDRAFTHQKGFPAGVPPPEQCPLDERASGVFPGHIRMVPVAPKPSPADTVNAFWFKPDFTPEAPFPDSYDAHCAAAAYFSDHLLLATAWLPHCRRERGLLQRLAPSSLCHSMWFHKPFTAHDWLLHHMTSPVAAAERALCFGHIYTRTGELVISTAQEGLLRIRRDPQQLASRNSSSSVKEASPRMSKL